MCRTLLPLKFLVDTDAWQFGSKTKLIFYIFLLFKKRFRATGQGGGHARQGAGLGAHRYILLSHLKSAFAHKLRPKYA